MSEYRAIYKCRMCGEEYSGIQVNSTIAFAATVAFGCGAAESFDLLSMNTVIYKTNNHECKDGSLGLADFIGFRKVE